eukprot:CAMPEP_0116125158 /NCGR_PEP_ID=MMETSP0329-20121206/5660_1 /TAXON_ID=697910 /ORGANISM="Pseudo-nitzschia arenysensis, Strain B593" /LENGTH=571 /DNA_ID=CAMNT_0003619177 /DNA_START=238 /DNA_END=1953 /DNA_ORIENTATION=-
MAAPIKMDELLVSWLGSDDVYENVLNLIEKYEKEGKASGDPNQENQSPNAFASNAYPSKSETPSATGKKQPIPPFYPLKTSNGITVRRRRKLPKQFESWDPLPDGDGNSGMNRTSGGNTAEDTNGDDSAENSSMDGNGKICVRDQILKLLQELQVVPQGGDMDGDITIDPKFFVRITKEICHFPSFFNGPLYQRILHLWNTDHPQQPILTAVTLSTIEWYWKKEMEPYDPSERFFRLIKQPGEDCILRDDFLPYIKALLNDHPGLEFLSNHAEFQEKYAVTVITRIFYSVNKCHSGRITSRQVRRSDLLEAFSLVDEEEDINKVTRYFSYEHFYVLYCRFWELDHDRDYRITREDLLKYGDHSLSHMIVDRIFDSAPRPFEHENIDREYLSYEEFIYFMLSEEDKSNEVSVRYWFNCVDVDGDSKLNNMEMRSFYAVQLHRMQCMGHEIVPFEDMLCQMMDMIKPKNPDHLVVEDFMQAECAQVSGALFDALFNLNKYLLFEQRDPFVERQKREDEFETDWDRFACIDYNRLAMEEEAREEEAMEIDWVTVDEDEEEEPEFNGAVTSEAPF